VKPPPEPPAAVRPIKVLETVQQAKLVHRVEPVYPPVAKQIHLQGTVIIRALISREGTIRSLQVLSGHPILAKAASEAIGEWRYQPTLLNGTAVEVETMVTVIFILH
jgi:protein TonB